MSDSLNPPSNLNAVVAHLLVMRGLYKTAQLSHDSGVWHIKNQGEPEIFVVSAEQNPRTILEFIQTQQIRDYTAYHFCDSEMAMEQLNLVYSRNRSVRFKKFFLMRKTLEQTDIAIPIQIILKKHFVPLIAQNVDSLPLMAQKPGSDLYAILENKKMLSWARNSCGADGSSWVSDVYTQTKARKQGLAGAIMSKIHADAAKLGHSQVFLGVHPENVRFYQKMGYEIILHGVRLTNHKTIWQRLLARVDKFLKR